MNDLYKNADKYTFQTEQPIATKLSDALFEKIKSVANPVFYPKNSEIFQQDIASNKVYVIESGTVKISHVLADGFESTMAIYSDRNIFGELSAIYSVSPTPSCKAVTDVHLYLLAVKDVQKMIKDPEFAEAFIMSLLHKLNIASRQTYMISGISVFDRVKMLLPTLCCYGYFPDKDGWYSITHSEIASIIGTTRSQVTTYLNRLKDTGIIQIKRNKIKVLFS